MKIPPYICVDIPALGRILSVPNSQQTASSLYQAMVSVDHTAVIVFAAHILHNVLSLRSLIQTLTTMIVNSV